MSEPVNIRLLEPGTRVGLVDGATAEIVSNPFDGVWLFVFTTYYVTPYLGFGQ